MMCLKDLKWGLENYSKKMTDIKSVIKGQDAGLNWESQQDIAVVMNKLQFFFSIFILLLSNARPTGWIHVAWIACLLLD